MHRLVYPSPWFPAKEVQDQSVEMCFLPPRQAAQDLPSHITLQFSYYTKQAKPWRTQMYYKTCPKSDLIRFDRIVIELDVVICLMFVCLTRSG